MKNEKTTEAEHRRSTGEGRQADQLLQLGAKLGTAH